MADHDVLMAYLRDEFARLHEVLASVEPEFPRSEQATVENLGRISPWQIREFPEKLRRELTDEARNRRVSVGEFLTGYIVLLRDLGWPDPKVIDAVLSRRTNSEPPHDG